MTTTTEPGTKLSRRYFANLLGLGAVAAAVSASVVAKAAAAVAEQAIDATDAVAQQADMVWKVTSEIMSVKFVYEMVDQGKRSLVSRTSEGPGQLGRWVKK